MIRIVRINKKIILRAFAVALLTTGTFIYCVCNGKSEAPQLKNHKPVGAVSAGMTVEQRFVAERDGLSSVGIIMATYMRENVGLFNVSIVDESNEREIFAQTVNMGSVLDNKSLEFKFERQASSLGKTYRLRISGVDGATDKSVTLYSIPEIAGSHPYKWNGAVVEGREVYMRLRYNSIVTAAWESLVVLAFLLCVWLIEWIKYGSETAHPAKEKKDFDWGMHYFRGFAIICIALMHLISGLGYDNFTSAFFRNSTVYFLFISGYLCQFIAAKKLDSPFVYYKKKLQNVILPYLICSTITLLFLSISSGARFCCLSVDALRHCSVSGFLRFYYCGMAQGQYWYIPFVVVLFAASPWFVRLSNKRLIACTTIAFLFAIIFPTRGDFLKFWPNVPYLYTHFTCYYLLGFVYFRFRGQFDEFLRPNVLAFLIAFLVIGVWILYPGLFGVLLIGSSFRASFQKLLLVGVFLVLCGYIKNKKITLFDAFAKYSFTIFFIHGFFIQTFIDEKTALQSHVLSAGSAITLDIFLCVVFLGLMLFVSWLLKLAFGKYSRYFIGS